jgi:hypothetical protein
MLIITDRTNILNIVHYPRNKIKNFQCNEFFCFPVETHRETYFAGIFKIGNTGQHQFPACKKKRGDLYRLDVPESKYGNQIAPSSTVFERRVFKAKITILLK